MPSSAQTAVDLSMLREASATSSTLGALCIAGSVRVRAIAAAPSTPHRIVLISDVPCRIQLDACLGSARGARVQVRGHVDVAAVGVPDVAIGRLDCAVGVVGAQRVEGVGGYLGD